MRLIDADRLFESIYDNVSAPYEEAVAAKEDCLCEIEDAPTVDAVPVVRCKDCIHYDLGVCLKIYSDGNAHPEAWQPRRFEDFCNYGERKGEANDS